MSGAHQHQIDGLERGFCGAGSVATRAGNRERPRSPAALGNGPARVDPSNGSSNNSPYVGADGLWRVPVAGGEPAIVDADDAEWLGQYRWYSSGRGAKYVTRSYRAAGRKHRSSMHREILGAPAGVIVDHINRDPRDNRRSNLRLADASQNSTNARGTARSKLGYRGIEAKGSGYRAVLRCRGKDHKSNTLATPELAAKAYDLLARAYHGEFAVLNFPQGEAA